AAEMPAEFHHIASKECTLESVKEIARICQYAPRMATDWKPCKMHIVLVDEGDQMSYPAQLAFLSLLDSTAPLPNTIIIFTGNDTANLEARFMSRCRVLEFSSYGMSAGLAELLQRIWDSETDNPVERPNFARIVKDNANNARGALMSLETEIMSAEVETREFIPCLRVLPVLRSPKMTKFLLNLASLTILSFELAALILFVWIRTQTVPV